MKTTISIFLFGILLLTSLNKVIGQTYPKVNLPSWVGVLVGSTKEGVSGTLLNEYTNIISKYQNGDNEWWKNIETKISTTD